MSRKPRGGVGSNQYARRAGPTTTASRRASTAAAMSAAVSDPSPDEVAWAFDPEARQWTAVGLSWEAAQVWVDAGFHAGDVKHWTTAVMTQAPDRQRVQFTVDEATEWVRAGFKDPAEAADFHAVGATPPEAQVWQNLGQGPDWVARWRECGFTAADAGEWTDFTPPSAQAWRTAGFTATEAAAWRSRAWLSDGPADVSTPVLVEWSIRQRALGQQP